MGRKFQAQRLELVANALAQLLTHERICELYAREWNVRPEQVKRYIRKVEQMWRDKAATPQPVDERRAYLTEVALVILRKQIGKGHEASAQRTLDMIAKWEGIGTAQLSAAINVYAPNGVMTSQAAIAEQMQLLEAEQEARAHALAKQIAGQLTSGDTDGENNIDDESNSEHGGDDDEPVH